MSTTIIINDFVSNRRAHLVFITSDFEAMAQIWDIEDPVLKELQEHQEFVGKTRWSDLEIKHFRLLLMQNLVVADSLTEDQMLDDDNTIVRSLNFLFMAFCYCLLTKVGGEIEILRVNRMSKIDITYDVQISFMRLDVDLSTANDHSEMTETSNIIKPPAFKSGMRVVVDNTKSED